MSADAKRFVLFIIDEATWPVAGNKENIFLSAPLHSLHGLPFSRESKRERQRRRKREKVSMKEAVKERKRQRQ